MPTINIRGTTAVLVLYEHYVIATLSPRNCQTVSSINVNRQQPKGRIYRARIYENIHEMTN